MKRIMTACIAAVLCCLTLASCGGPKTRVDNGVWGLYVVEMRRRNSGGFAEVEIDVRNRWERRMDIEYRFEWRDKENFTIGDKRTQWTPLVLKAGETKAVRSIAPNPQGMDAKLITRPSDPHRAPRI